MCGSSMHHHNFCIKHISSCKEPSFLGCMLLFVKLCSCKTSQHMKSPCIDKIILRNSGIYQVCVPHQWSRVSAVLSQSARPDEARERHSCSAGMAVSRSLLSCSLHRWSTSVIEVNLCQPVFLLRNNLKLIGYTGTPVYKQPRGHPQIRTVLLLEGFHYISFKRVAQTWLTPWIVQ